MNSEDSHSHSHHGHHHPHGRAPRHIERHFGSGKLVRDIVIGMSDGLTVPFALAAGITGAHASSKLVVVAGLAEIAAGSIAMGLGGYLAARTDSEHYTSEMERERREVIEMPAAEREEIFQVFDRYGLTREETVPIVDALEKRPEQWVNFMMQFELGLEAPEPGRALSSAATIAGSYVAGGFVPLLPYMVVHKTASALLWSISMTAVALAGFGYLKGYFTGSGPMRSAVQTLLIGAAAAACAFGLARLIS